MRPISEYIDNLNFEYVITYSGFRLEIIEKLKQENKKKIEKLEQEKEVAQFMKRPKVSKEIERLVEETNSYFTKIVDTNDVLHASAEVICKLEKKDKRLIEIFELLNIKFKEEVATMCAPVFRDAIVFYSSKSEVVGILHFCFSCWWVQDENEKNLEVDVSIFPALETMMKKLGHQIGVGEDLIDY